MASYRSQAPVGYSADTSGFMGATLLLSGIVAAIVTAPLFDRVLTHHLAITVKFLVPVVAAGWVSLIWAGRWLFMIYSNNEFTLDQSSHITLPVSL